MLLSYCAPVKDGMLVVSGNLLKFRECIDPVWYQCGTVVGTGRHSDHGISVIAVCGRPNSDSVTQLRPQC